MKYRKFGRLGWDVSEIGFGGWAIGGSWGKQKEEDSLSALRRALELGCNFIDTAAAYGGGKSERVIGQVLPSWKGRVYVATKTHPAPGPWPPTPYCRCEERYPEKYLRESVEERLKNLRTDSLDVLQLHTWTRAWNRNPTAFQVLRKMQKEGKIRAIGISTPEQDQNAVNDLMKDGWVDVVQVIYNIFDQEPAAELLPIAQEKGVGIIVRVAFDEGSLTGKFTASTTFPKDDFRSRYFEGDRVARTVARVEKIKKELEGSGYTLPQAALKFALSHPGASTVIPGIRNVGQAEANCGVADLADLPAGLLERLRGHAWQRAFWYAGKE